MKFHDDIMRIVRENTFFRQEIVTGSHSQVVVMSIPVGGEIGVEVHEVDQTLLFVEGTGEAILDDEKTSITAGHLVFVPAGTKHNFLNTGLGDMKLITVYAPPEHQPGTVHKTKAEADAAEGH